ncbi:unnamed protein product [Nesidiocoris tenuis]|uniref:DNA polymerase epsilon catalytic subunit n=1 Tax=Nesidiocoris tenuis TaxID=355587 RepID=A0A6H5GVN9_9HEMI|nr:unnamed protein product [Nesidiocoris tenuis]
MTILMILRLGILKTSSAHRLRRPEVALLPTLAKENVKRPPEKKTYKTYREALGPPPKLGTTKIAPTNSPGVMRVWALVGSELHQIRLIVPRIFYVNHRVPKEELPGALYKKCNRILPRSRPMFYLYEYTVPEEVYQEHSKHLRDSGAAPVPLAFETRLRLRRRSGRSASAGFGSNGKQHVHASASSVQNCCLPKLFGQSRNQLETSLPVRQSRSDWFTSVLRALFTSRQTGDDYRPRFRKNESDAEFGVDVFCRKGRQVSKKFYISFFRAIEASNKPGFHCRLERAKDDIELPPAGIVFDTKFETDPKQVYKHIQASLQIYRDEKKGPTLIAVQSQKDIGFLTSAMPTLNSWPIVPIHVQDKDSIFNVLDWQRVGSKLIIKHFLNMEPALALQTEQCRCKCRHRFRHVANGLDRRNGRRPSSNVDGLRRNCIVQRCIPHPPPHGQRMVEGRVRFPQRLRRLPDRPFL